MRYLLAIWKASRPTNSGEGWETMRRELSVLYSRFCKCYSGMYALFSSGMPRHRLMVLTFELIAFIGNDAHMQMGSTYPLISNF